MNTNLKTLALALVAGLSLTACAADPACAPKAEEPTPVALAAAPTAETAAATVASEQVPAEKQAKPRRTRRAKRDKATMPADGQQKTPRRRRRARKMDSSELPVTGMLDSAE